MDLSQMTLNQLRRERDFARDSITSCACIPSLKAHYVSAYDALNEEISRRGPHNPDAEEYALTLRRNILSSGTHDA